MKSSRLNSGFSLLELVVVIAIISTLATFLLQRFLVLQAAAEKVAMETVVGTLRSAMGMEIAQYYVNNNLRGARKLVGSNPMKQLAQVPANYLGEFNRANPGSLETGNWYFDKRQGVLVYLVKHTSYFKGGASKPKRIRFAVRLVYDRGSRRSRRKIEGIRISALDSYRWKRKDI